MQLIKFLTIGTIFSLVLGEFGHYPFGDTTFAVRLTDVLLAVTLGFLAIWQIGITRKILYPKVLYFLIFFWFVGLLSLIFSGNYHGIFYLLRFILYSLTSWLGYSLIKTKTISLSNLLWMIIYSGLILSLLGFLQLIFFPDFESLTAFGYDPHKHRLASTFLDPNFIGSFLNICLLFSFYLLQKNQSSKKLLFLILLFIISIISTESRSALLMLFVEIFILGFFKNRKLLIFLIPVALIMYFFVPTSIDRIYNGLTIDESAGERIKSWNNGVFLFKQDPLFGVGFDNLRDAMEKNNLFKVYSENGGHAGAGIDSSIIFVLATTGVIGLISYLSWWIFLVRQLIAKKFTKNYLLSISLILLIGLFINSQFINSLFYTPIMFIIFLFFGAVVGLDDQGE